jgi:putative hydrolase of the HAD superfamily
LARTWRWSIWRAAARKARLAILSNATLELEAHLAEHGIAALFDPILNSARIGLRKPDPRCFHYALDALGAPASAVLFIDDKRRNTRVAGALGMHCHDFVDAATLAEALACLGLLP